MKVLGVVLVHNEDLFVRCAVENILPCCDEVLILNHRSTDNTERIIQELAAAESKIRLLEIDDPTRSHEPLEEYVGRDYWVFGVDGDEIYDPVRTVAFFHSLREGRYSGVFQIRGNVLHVDEVEGSTFHGYLAPPGRAMNKLYNFSLLKSWTGCFERLHGGERVLKDGVETEKRLAVSDDHDFAVSPFRCLHLVFLRRSSLDPDDFVPRLNIADQVSARWSVRISRYLRRIFGLPVASPGKLANYRVGDRERIEDGSFRLQKEELPLQADA
ncbi:MAG: glycosyltransferase family 2 protein [Verrucomicrobiota bacterium]